MTKKFGQWLEQQMQDENLNYSGLAALFNVKPNTARSWVLGDNEPSKKNLEQIGARFRVSMDFIYELLGRIPPDTEDPEDIRRMKAKLVNLTESRRRMVERLTDDLLDEQAQQSDARQ